MKVLVVGAAGYLGRHVWRKLEERGHEVVAVDGLFWGQEAPRGLVCHTVLSVEDIGHFNADSLIWLGAIAHDPHGKVPGSVQEEYTGWAPWNTLKDWRKRAVFVSTLSVFNQLDLPNSYPNVKRNAERNIFADNLRTCNIVRFGTLYGPGVTVDSHREHLLLNKMVYDALKHGEVRVANPNARRPIFGVEEAANCVITEAVDDYPTGVHNCFTYCRTIREYGEFVGKLLKVPVRVTEGVDTRDYGWPDGLEGVLEQCLPADLEPLVSWTREHLEEIKPRRQIFEVAP